MYGLVPYLLSDKQMGIQLSHALTCYSVKHKNVKGYDQWSTMDHTIIMLNGGTTNNNEFNQGMLNQHYQNLLKNGIPVAEFYEPSLGDQLTAIVFLADERVWDHKKYPIASSDDLFLGLLDDVDDLKACKWIEKLSKNESDKIKFLRSFITPLKLA